MITHGIGPYYKTKLIDKIKSASYFVASYDESLNRNFQEEQMDIHIRYFDCNKNIVETNYFDSCFLKRPNSLNLHDCLFKSFDSLDISKLIQVSMDGPNTNWDVLERHKTFRSSKDLSSLFVIGSCGLHVIYDALETMTKSTEWDFHKVLHAMWRIFDESPARRDIYLRRWVEDEPVAERDIQIWSNVVKVIRYWLASSVSKRSRNNKSFDTLVKYHNHPLMICKFQFFKYVASVLKYFLVDFQTNKPMLPFLATAVEKLYRKCLTLFMKRDVVDGCPTSSLLNLDLEKEEYQHPLVRVDW